MEKRVDFKWLEGKTVSKIRDMVKGSKLIRFKTDCGSLIMLHEQDCCESVEVDDVCGNIHDLLNSVIISAIETSEEGVPSYGTSTWTFYTISTIKGSVTLRWYGESNGYYSESVSCFIDESGCKNG